MNVKPYYPVIYTVYGVALTLIGFMLMGSGHGVYAVFCLFAGVLSFFGIVGALIGNTLLWSLIGFLLSRDRTASDIGVLVLVLCNYCASAYLILSGTQWSDLYLLHRGLGSDYMAVLCFGLLLYACGQLVIWFTIVKRLSMVFRASRVSRSKG